MTDPYEDALLKRIKDSEGRKDDSGRFRSIYIDNLPRPVLKLGTGSHIIDILQYEVGENDPFYEKGDLTYILEVWVHYGVGVGEDAFVCMARTFGARKNPKFLNTRCPICEYQSRLKQGQDYDEELVKSLNPKRRALYWVVCYDSVQEEQKGVQLLDIAHWHMERHLPGLAKITTGRSGANVGGWIPFPHPEKGKSIAFEKKGKAPNIEIVGHKFEDRIVEGRPYVITKELLDQCVPLDECIVFPAYEVVARAFFGSDTIPDSTPSRSRGRETGDGVSVTPVDEGTTSRRRGTIPVEEPSEEKAEVAEPALARRVKTKEVKEPEVQEEKIYEGNRCPSGYIFGVDAEKFDGCNLCPDDVFQDCVKEKMAAEAETTQSSQRRLGSK